MKAKKKKLFMLSSCLFLRLLPGTLQIFLFDPAIRPQGALTCKQWRCARCLGVIYWSKLTRWKMNVGMILFVFIRYLHNKYVYTAITFPSSHQVLYNALAKLCAPVAFPLAALLICSQNTANSLEDTLLKLIKII